MKVVILTNRQGNQSALANKISRHAEVAAVVLSKNIPARRPDRGKRAKLLINRVAGRTVGRPFVRTWFDVLAKYDAEYTKWPTGNIVEVDNVNDAATIDAIERAAPQLVVVSGTNIVGKRVIETAQKAGGIVNLHTGISPYVRGGPNCTNWCLAQGWFHLIGNTVMWLNAGIDTGNIIATEQTPLDGSESLFELHWKVMEHAHEIYVRSIRNIGDGKQMPSISQHEIAEGSYFDSAGWTAAQMIRALTNYRRHYRAFFAESEKRRLVSSDLRLYPVLDA